MEVAAPSDAGELLATIPKTPRAEVRLHRKHHAGRTVLDMRVWFIPDGQAEFVPSRKGVTFDASKTAMLIDALSTE